MFDVAEETPQSAADEAAEEAALEAGFNDTDVEPVSTEDTTPPATSETTPEPSPATPAALESPKFLTQDDLTAALAAQKQEHQQEMQRIHDKVFGKVGELKQRIDGMKSAGSFSAKTRERLTAEFPELAAMLFEDDDPPVPAPAATAPAEPAAPVSTPTPAQTAWEEDPLKVMERRLLTRDHKDWEQVVVSPAFNTWRTTVLAPTDNEKLDEVWDADFVSEKLTEFKAWQAEQAKIAQANKVKQDRLDAAVTPRGVPRGSAAGFSDDDEEAAMEAAYKAGR